MRLSEAEALFSFASLAADFVLEAENWPAFVAWFNEHAPGGARLGLDDHDHAGHLAEHLEELSDKVNQIRRRLN